MVPDVVVIEGNSLHSVVRKDGDGGGGDAEEELIIPLGGGNRLRIREGALKIQEGQVIVHEEGADVFHDEIDVPAVPFQLGSKEILMVVGIPADGEIPGAGNGHDIGAVTVLLLPGFFLLGDLDELGDIELGLLHHHPGDFRFLSEGAGDAQEQEGGKQGEFSEHIGPPVV